MIEIPALDDSAGMTREIEIPALDDSAGMTRLVLKGWANKEE